MYYKQACYRCGVTNVFNTDKASIELDDFLCPSCNETMDDVDITKLENN
jgi:transcription initiation factor IIE alpha subunit